MSATFRPGEFPAIVSPVFATSRGTLYLRHPGVQMTAKPTYYDASLRDFLEGFPENAGLRAALDDPVTLSPATSLCKAAGQLCYMSFGRRRTPNAEADRYFANILQSGHGSVLEHASFSFLIYGVSRSVTHELVRHRAGFAFSQVSQRYVSAAVLRFVERLEFQVTPELHDAFERRIDAVAQQYADLQNTLQSLQRGGVPTLDAANATDRRKRVQQAARALLPNETEAPIMVTANVRSWRHFIEARANEHADVEIRMLAHCIFQCLRSVEPVLFADYAERQLDDGTFAVTTATPKV